MDITDNNSAISSLSTTTSSSKYEASDEFSSDNQLSTNTSDDFSLDEFLLSGIDCNATQRSVLLTRPSLESTFGFALQSYVFKRSSSETNERITYVDYVSVKSPAYRSGVKRGDIVIAVNENCVIKSSHPEIVDSISQCLHVTLVLVFKDVARIVELSMRSIKLRFLLDAKDQELKKLEDEEKELEKLYCSENEESVLYELDEELKAVQYYKSSNPSGTDYHHLIRINSSNSIGSPQVTRL